MSTSWKVFIGVLVVVGALFGFNYYVNSKNDTTIVANTENIDQTTETTTTQTSPTDSISSSGTADESLDHDLASIDTQINAVNSSSAEVDSSLNDKPIAQTE